MDIFSHALWSVAIFKLGKKKFKVLQAAFWGAFPDLLSFTFLFIWLILMKLFKNLNPQEIVHLEPYYQNHHIVFKLTSLLYSMSHSLIIFITIFAIIYLIKKRIIWEMFGWLIHILLDIPTHSYEFYPTPFLWPISNWKLNGYSWASKEFMIINYGLLIVIYIYFYRKEILKKLNLK